MDRSGQRLDTYRLLRYLGSGSFGKVYLAEHTTHHTTVAIKVFPGFAEQDLPFFLNEARIIRLKHPHILPVLDFGIDKSEPFIVTEYISSGTVRSHYPKGTRLPVTRLAVYIQQIASALQYAHDEKMIHRDVKPENILMRSDIELLLGDFGVATIAHNSSSLHSQGTAGTLPYMAPEQIQGKAQPASDQYALGIIAYEWLCGERPFQGNIGELVRQHLEVAPTPLRKKREDIPAAVEETVLKALSKNPVRRFPSVQDFATQLTQACAQATMPSMPGRKITREIPLIHLLAADAVFSKQNRQGEPPAGQKQNKQSESPASPPPSPSSPPPWPSSALTPGSSPTQASGVATHARSKAASQATARPTPSAGKPLPTLTANIQISSSLSQAQKGGLRRFYALFVLVILVSIILLTGASGIYYLVTTSQINGLASFIEQTSHDPPAQALLKLADAQKKIQDIKHRFSLGVVTTAQITDVQNKLITATKSAMLRYNQNGLITLVPCGNSGITTDDLRALTLTSTTTDTYILSQDGEISYVSQNAAHQYKQTSAFVPPANMRVVSLAGAGKNLFMLSRQISNGITSAYALAVFNADANGKLQTTSALPLIFTQANDLLPTRLAAWSDGTHTTLYVLLTSKSQSDNTAIQVYTFDAQGFAGPTSSPFTVAQTVVSLAVLSNRLFLLEADGSVLSSIVAANHTIASAVPVVISQPIAPPLAVDPQQFTASTSVPVSSASTLRGKVPLTVPSLQNTPVLLSTVTMTTGGNSQNYLLIGDSANHRVLDFTLPASSTQDLTLSLVQQYVSHTFFTTIQSLTATSATAITVLDQRTPSEQDLLVIDRKNCPA